MSPSLTFSVCLKLQLYISQLKPFRRELASLSRSFLAEAGSHNQPFQVLALEVLGDVALEFDGVSREK